MDKKQAPQDANVSKSAWMDINTAPKDGSLFTGWNRGESRKRNTWFGKASHARSCGWCWGRNVKDIDVWEPTHWRPKS